MKLNGFWHLTWVTLLVVSLVACARVLVVKVPTPTQYLEWTDEMQAEADDITGVRFYLPRPFINVFESFPIRTDVVFATGTVSPDGRYVVIKTITDRDGNTVFDSAGIEISNRNIFRPEGLKDLIEAQSATVSTTPTVIPTPPASISTAIPTPSATPVSEKPQGVKELKVSNDPNAFTYQPMRGNFDLVYMPDFEEQYALRVKGGLGRAKASLAMGQGWSLQGLEATADNSALAKRLYQLIDTASELAQDAALAALGKPPLAGATDFIRPQSTTVDGTGVPGTPVTLKITFLHYAAKGLYPVLKPREVQQRRPGTILQDGVDLMASYLVTADLGRPAHAVDFHAQVDGIGTVIIPMYPYQYVSFNTFRYVAVEALGPDEPFARLYDKTGTSGDPGDRQKKDLGGLIDGLIQGQGRAELHKNHEAALKRVAIDVKSAIAGNDDLSGFTVDFIDLSEDGGKVATTVVLSQSNGDEGALKNYVATVLNILLRDLDSKLQVGDITVKKSGE